MNWLQAIVFSLVEGLTEFLPVSSTAHLLLLDKIYPVADSEFFANFAVVIQLGAILAVVVVFWQSVWRNKDIWWKLILAVLPTAVIGLVLKDFVDQYLQDASIWTGVMLILGGIVFSYLDYRWSKGQKAKPVTDKQLTTVWVDEVKKMPWYKMVGVGIGQSLALIPGVSRSGATIYTARGIGFSKLSATALAFVLGVATIAGASGLSVVKHWDVLMKTEVCYTGFADARQWVSHVQAATTDKPLKPLPPLTDNITDEDNEIVELNIAGWPPPTVCNPEIDWSKISILSASIIMTFVFSFLVVKKFIKFLAEKPFWYFGLYRVVIGIIWIILFL